MREFDYITNLCLGNFRKEMGLQKINSQANIKLVPVGNQLKQTIVKEKINDFKNNTGKQTLFVNAYKGIFLLKGDRKDLDILKDLGLGFRRNQGFGMVEVLNG